MSVLGKISRTDFCVTHALQLHTSGHAEAAIN